MDDNFLSISVYQLDVSNRQNRRRFSIEYQEDVDEVWFSIENPNNEDEGEYEHLVIPKNKLKEIISYLQSIQ